ncbi:RHS repeat-associated core domain-containing protein [Actinoplanes sp. DH11]|uniref:RHS repeat-associated core domain-containing protein n=1 Tax=Actinoplanes sp. DH11 TaxID=2857011 RepID=UPI001E2B81B3|nr:RHS repeat-associated core domain-containing protein [Actinoplanes sp. DH11]
MAARSIRLSIAGLTALAAVIAVPQPAVAAPPPAPSTAEKDRPAQPASPGSGKKIALSTSSAKASLLAGPVSVPKGTGPARNATFTSFALSDRVSLDVNVGSGNLLVRTTDMTLPGLEDDLVLGAAYNSLFVGSDIQSGSLGHGWRTRSGIDVKLIKADDNSVTYVASDGVVGRFVKTSTGYTSPSEFKATLVADGAGWKLTEHSSGREQYFTSAGLLDRTLDRNDNVTDYTYDTAGQLTSIKSDRGSADARTVQVYYHANGKIETIKQFVNGSAARGIGYFYDAAGDLAGIATGTGRWTGFSYDAQHRLTAITSGVLDSAGDTGATTRLTYDSAHRVTSVTRAYDSGGSTGATTRFAYPSATETLVADANQDLTQPVAGVPRTTYTINSDKRVTKAVDPAGKERKKTYTPLHDVASATDALNNTSSNTFGANSGQSLTTSSSATGSKTTWAYANAPTSANPTANYQPSSSTDTQGNASAFTYNGAGNKLSSKDALAAEAKVEYNSDGTVKKSTDPGNGTNGTTYVYNGDKQLTKLTPPTGNSLGARDFTYDSFGRIRTASDGAGRVATYEYDLDDRIVGTWYSDSTTPVTYSHDGAGNITQRQAADGARTFTFDRLNRPVGRYDHQWYGYDPVGNLIHLVDERGNTYYEYNSRNLLTKATAGSAVYTFVNDDEGRRTHTRLSVTKSTPTPQYVAETQNAFDKSGRLTRTTTKRWQKVNGTDTASTVYDVSYCYAKRVGTAACSTVSADDTGLRQWQTDHHRAGAVTVYTHDKGNRLTKAANFNGKTYDYTYDSNGNRKTSTVDGVSAQALTFNSANQISSSGYTYDAAGNQTNGSATRSATYNAAGHTTSNQNASGATTSYHYAGPDQVELSWTDGAHGEGWWWGLNAEYGQPVVQSYTTSNWTKWHYIERDDRQNPLGTRVHESGGERHFFYVLDGIGSVVGLVDDNGALAGTRSYDPYGKVTATVANAAEMNETVLGYAGGLANGDLTKFGKRWYDANTGRFTQQDALTFLADPAQGNRYAYAAGNPCDYTDPTGLKTGNNLADACIEGAAGGLVAGAIGGAFAGPKGIAVGAALGAIGGCAGKGIEQAMEDS